MPLLSDCRFKMHAREYWESRLVLKMPYGAISHNIFVGLIEMENSGHIDCLEAIIQKIDTERSATSPLNQILPIQQAFLLIMVLIHLNPSLSIPSHHPAVD